MDDKVYTLLEQMPVVNGFRQDSCVEVRPCPCCPAVSTSPCCLATSTSPSPSEGSDTPHHCCLYFLYFSTIMSYLTTDKYYALCHMLCCMLCCERRGGRGGGHCSSGGRVECLQARTCGQPRASVAASVGSSGPI